MVTYRSLEIDLLLFVSLLLFAKDLRTDVSLFLNRLSASVAIGIWGYLIPFYFITAYTVLKVPTLDPSSLSTALPLILTNLSCE